MAPDFFFLSSHAWLRKIGATTLLFDEESQLLLSPAAHVEKMWPALETGATTMDLANAADITLDEVMMLLPDLVEAEIVQLPPKAVEPFVPAKTFYLDLVVTQVAIHTQGAVAQAVVQEVFGHAKSQPRRCPDVLFIKDTKDGVVFAPVGDHPPTPVSTTEAGALLRAALTDLVLEAMEDLALHASLIGSRNGGLICIGEPGAGKSVLAAVLQQAEFDLLGDDVVILDEAGAARAVPFPLTLKSDAWELLANDVATLKGREAYLRADGKRVKYLPVSPPRANAEAKSIRAICDLVRQSDTEARLESVDPAQAIGRLIQSGRTPDDQLSCLNFDILVELLDAAPFYRMFYDTPDDAVRLVRELTATW